MKDDLQSYIENRAEQDPEFKAAYEAEAALLALVRAGHVAISGFAPSLPIIDRR